MSIIFTLIPVGLVLLLVAVAAFFWAVRSGQYEDLDSPAWRVILDDDRAPPRHSDNSGDPGEVGKPDDPVDPQDQARP